MASKRRRAKRSTPKQQTKLLSSIARREAEEFEAQIRDELAGGIQNFAVKAMNSLAEKGPAWTGEFSASWGFAPAGRTPDTPGTTGQIYKYTKNDAPIRDIKRFLKDGVSKFNIVNTSSHAAIATDQEESYFAPPKEQPDPIKIPVEFGTERPGDPHLRYQIRYREGDEITSQITAEKDWFTTYLKAGGLQKDLTTGFTFGREVAGR